MSVGLSLHYARRTPGDPAVQSGQRLPAMDPLVAEWRATFAKGLAVRAAG